MAESEPNTRIARFYLRNKDTGIIQPSWIEPIRWWNPPPMSRYVHHSRSPIPLHEVPLYRRVVVFSRKERKTREDLTHKPKDDAEAKEIKKRNGDLKLRFAHRTLAGKDDPVADGRDLAFAGDVLPSDRKDHQFRSRGNVAIGTSEEKELADLARRGILRGGSEEGGITLESVKGDGPEYTVRVVSRKRRGGKGRGKGKEEGEISSGGEDAGEVSPAEGEVVTSWEEFLAEMEAEGWVPVAEDDLASVAESWVVMQEEEEQGVEKTLLNCVSPTR